MTIKELVPIAVDYLKGFFPDADKIQIEEIEITDDSKYWNVTLSYENIDSSDGSGAWLLTKSRKFKIFKIDAKTGEVRAMKIRDFK